MDNFLSGYHSKFYTMYKNITIIGAGNVATNLSQVLRNCGYKIIQIYSRTKVSAKTLADKLNTAYTTDLSQIYNSADLFIISISDNAIETVLEQIAPIIKNKLIVHTAGSINLDIFAKQFENYGVFYPLQTFSKTETVNFDNIPLCIEANNDANVKILLEIAGKISKNVHNISSEQRRQIHLAAVFACNFTNHMYAIANNLLNEKQIPFDIIKPLIIETTQKAINNKPLAVQTGPAVRNDKNVIKTHLNMLKSSEMYKKIYNFVSESIFNHSK